MSLPPFLSSLIKFLFKSALTVELIDINKKTYKRDVINFCYDFDVFEFEWNRFSKGQVLVIFNNRDAAIEFLDNSYYLVLSIIYQRN